MSLKTIVKVSHVSNLSDARYCAGMGVEMLGFQVIPGGDQYVSPEVYQDIRGWISGPRIVAEIYGLSDPDQIGEILKAYAPDYFELTLEQFRTFGAQLPIPGIVYVEPSEAGPFQDQDKILYLLTGETTSCGEAARWGHAVIKKISSVAASNKSLEEGCFAGVALRGPGETRPGVTNYDQLGAILESLETD